MAEEKPKPERDIFVDIVSGLFVLFVLSAIFASINSFFEKDPLFQHGLSGLTPSGIVLDYTRPVASLFQVVGAHVVAIGHPTNVLNDAGSIVIGYQNFGKLGIILSGPVEVNGINYYNVDWRDNPDGWVAEGDIAYQESQPSIFAQFLLFLWRLLTYIGYLLWIFAVLIFIFLIRIIRKLTVVRENNRARLYPAEAIAAKPINASWERIRSHLDSPNTNDWRVAIMEADIMLDDLLDAMQLPGDTMGDKLKAVEKADFTTLDNAWEAHKVRNQIAHDGSAFELSHHEAQRVIALYEAVFREFQLI